jgi:hypothetical protein
MLAAHMGLMPEIAIFRRFGDLTARNLLYLQAELLDLGMRLREVEHRDHFDKDPQKEGYLYAADWYNLYKSKDRDDGRQWELVIRVREKLEEYRELLLAVPA